MNKIKQIIFFVLLILLTLPLITSADCPNNFVDVEWRENFIVSKDVGAIFDLAFELPLHLKINSSSFSLYLEDGNNIPEISEFIIYPVDFQNKKLTSEEIVIKVKTTIKNRINFPLSVEKFNISQNRLGFIICTSENSKFIFTGSGSEGTDRDPYLTLEYTEGIDTKVANYISLSEKRRAEFDKAIENYNKRPEIIEQQRIKNIRDIIIAIFGGIIGGIILLGIVKLLKLTYKKIKVKSKKRDEN